MAHLNLSADEVLTTTRAVRRRLDTSRPVAPELINECLEIAVQADASFLQWVLYAPLDRPIVCLEPYTCTGDAANLAARGIESGLITLPPGLTWQSTIRMLVRQL